LPVGVSDGQFLAFAIGANSAGGGKTRGSDEPYRSRLSGYEK